MATNVGVKGKVVEAGNPTKGITGLTVTAWDIDPLSADDHLGTATTGTDGSFNISYSASKYRPWFVIPEVNPDIEIRIFGAGNRLLFEKPIMKGVSDAVKDVGEIPIHPSNIPIPDTASAQQRKDDPYWLVTHTTLDPKNGTPVRLTRDNHIDWLVDGDAMFPKLTEDVEQAQQSIHFMNSKFYVKQLKSRLNFSPKTPETVTATDVVKVDRLERLMRDRAANNVEVRVLVWDLRNTPLYDGFDTADEVSDFFESTQVHIDTFESTQMFHIKGAVIDGTKGYVLGSTMAQGYFADTKHLIRDARHSGGQLMHDVCLRVVGPAVHFVDRTFATVWNVNPSPVQVTPVQPSTGGAQAAIAAQVLRTLPGNVFIKSATGPDIEHLPDGETGILEAYQRAIMKAEEYVYIEDQYFTSPEISTAISQRIQSLHSQKKPPLEVIVVLNVEPDIAGYPAKQTAIIKELVANLGALKSQLGVFTMWSTGKQQPLEIAPVYVHAKVGIVDDLWATVGSANLDGASLNERQFGLMAMGVIREFSFKEFVRKHPKLVTLLLPALLIAPFLPVVGSFFLGLEVASSLFVLLSQMPFAIASLKKEMVRSTQHATPGRDAQPARHPELNLVVYNGIAGQPATSAVKDLREALWNEQLGSVPSTRPQGGWLSEFRRVAAANLAEIVKASNGQPHQVLAGKILEWSPQSKPEKYLKALGVTVPKPQHIVLRDGGEKMPFTDNDLQTP